MWVCTETCDLWSACSLSRALQQDCSVFEVKKTLWLPQSILKQVAMQLLHCFPLSTTSASVSITAFTWRLRPNELLRALPDKLWLQRFLMLPSQLPAQFPVPEVTSQSRLSRKECRAAPASPVHSQSSALFPNYFHQQFQPRCWALHRACVLCHQGGGTPALKPTVRFARMHL